MAADVHVLGTLGVNPTFLDGSSTLLRSLWGVSSGLLLLHLSLSLSLSSILMGINHQSSIKSNQIKTNQINQSQTATTSDFLKPLVEVP